MFSSLYICYHNISYLKLPHISFILEDLLHSVTPLQPHFVPLEKALRTGIFLQDLKRQGFSVKDDYSGQWTEEEKQEVSQFMLTLLHDPEGIDYYDLFTYISRNILKGSKSRVEVKKYLVSMLKCNTKD